MALYPSRQALISGCTECSNTSLWVAFGLKQASKTNFFEPLFDPLDPISTIFAILGDEDGVESIAL